MGTRPADPRCYLAEWYRPEVTRRRVDDIADELEAAAAAVAGEGVPVRLLVAVAAPTDEVLYGVFAADSPEIVIRTCQHAGIPAERLTADITARLAHQ
ncbi:hypothetical protein M4D79_06625 [Mycolicibacterium novocastrense]|nr:hypothetical protein M4D79_06625 [Mycolicibacterium novocastrense]